MSRLDILPKNARFRLNLPRLYAILSLLDTDREIGGRFEMKETYTTHSAAETEELGALLAARFPAGILGLYGDLGSGKTALSRGFVRAILPRAAVKSPTYTILNCYEAENACVYHIDLYRIADEDDLESVGFYELPPDKPILCEWAQRLPQDTPFACKITLVRGADENTRVITVEENDADTGD